MVLLIPSFIGGAELFSVPFVPWNTRALGLLVITAHLLVVQGLFAQELIKVSDLPDILNESSGLEITEGGDFWSHNDDGKPILYNFDTAGNIIKALHLRNINKGWEDLARDMHGNIYIGNFGNNYNVRKDLRIYKLPPPETIAGLVTMAEIIKFSYPEQREFPPSYDQLDFDMEAMICYQDSLFLFTKNRTDPFTGYTKVYRLPTQADEHYAELVDSVYLGAGPAVEYWITSADLSPDGKLLALLGHSKIWIFSCFQGSNFFGGRVTIIPLNHFSQKEAVCFANSTTLYLTDEKTLYLLGGSLYRYDLPPNEFNCN